MPVWSADVDTVVGGGRCRDPAKIDQNRRATLTRLRRVATACQSSLHRTKSTMYRARTSRSRRPHPDDPDTVCGGGLAASPRHRFGAPSGGSFDLPLRWTALGCSAEIRKGAFPVEIASGGPSGPTWAICTMISAPCSALWMLRPSDGLAPPQSSEGGHGSPSLRSIRRRRDGLLTPSARRETRADINDLWRFTATVASIRPPLRDVSTC